MNAYIVRPTLINKAGKVLKTVIPAGWVWPIKKIQLCSHPEPPYRYHNSLVVLTNSEWD